jgi:Ni/Co efflux regulator RcnB
MKRLVLTLVAGAFGSLLVLPIAHAQDYEDMNRDANQIRQEHRDIRNDRREQQEDIENGNFGAAAREQAEIEQRRQQMREDKRDLNNDVNRAYGNWHHHDDDNE